MDNLKSFLVAGRPLNTDTARSVNNPGKCSKSIYKILPYFFFLNAVICLVTFSSPFCIVMALIFTAWGVTNLLFCHCHRCPAILTLALPASVSQRHISFYVNKTHYRAGGNAHAPPCYDVRAGFVQNVTEEKYFSLVTTGRSQVLDERSPRGGGEYL